jgi:hypothetical protein
MKINLTLATLTGFLLLTSCEILGSTDLEPLDAEHMAIQYRVSGGWIHTSTLYIQTTGEASAERIGHGSGEVTDRATGVLTATERKRLAELLAWFPSYRSFYDLEPFLTDANTYQIILHYAGTIDTVGIYGPPPDMPRTLRDTIEELDRIYAGLIPQSPFILRHSARPEVNGPTIEE